MCRVSLMSLRDVTVTGHVICGTALLLTVTSSFIITGGIKGRVWLLWGRVCRLRIWVKMKRVRDIFRCPKSFRLRWFRPRCLCAEVDVSRCQSDEEVYQRSGYSDAGVKPKLKTPAKPSQVSSHYLLPGQCEDIMTQEELNVPEEPELKLQVEELPETLEVTSIHDFYVSEEELDVPSEPEDETEVEAFSDNPEVDSIYDFSEFEEELQIPIEAEVETEIEALPDTPEDVSVCDLSESEEEVHFLTDVSGAASSLQDFRCCAVLGEGSYGKVLLAEHKQTQDMFAIKALLKADIVTKLHTERLRYEKEIFKTVSSARHPFLINLFSSFQDEHYLFFAMEYAAGGDLLGNKAMIRSSFPDDRAVFYAACVVLGLEFLHWNKIVHRDLKLENVVLDKEGFAKLTDFGLSKAGMGFGDRTMSIVGTPLYMAPEMVTMQPYTRDVDWWSLGVLIYDMLAVKIPFEDDDNYQLANNIINAEVTFPQDWSPESVSLVSQLLVRDPARRLGSGEKGAEDVKRHPFFRDIKWRKLFLRELRPPFLPPLSGPEDVSNFEAEFTSMAPVFTSPEGPGLTQEQQELFKDFDWVAEWAP